ISLAIAVLVSYFWVLRDGAGIAAAQSAAFAAWLLGHLVLAAYLRAERHPLPVRALVANRMYLLWVAGVLALLTLGVTIPFVQARLHLVALSLTARAVVVAAALVFPSLWGALNRSTRVRSKEER
ncbi:MAG TPA: cation transporting ATPase C-terminal domain-containing protein, partial [Chloroflexota bacterium]|nr:cation transporting ATPase C-terminal domain-containing protein [Chloroflexota bacterium]